MAADHRGGDRSVAIRSGREESERRHPAKFGAPADRESVRGGDPDADPGEAARTEADEDASRRASVEQLGEHRHEPFAVAAADLLVSVREAGAAIVEQSGGAGGTRRVEREDHKQIVVTSGGKPQPPKK